MNLGSARTLIDLLRSRAGEQGEQTIYRFQTEDGEVQSLTYAALDRKARALAFELQQKGALGQRALLLYQPGLEYITAFFGCLYAGVVPVPAYPPRLNGNLGRLQAIVTDATASLALTSSAILAGLKRRFGDATWLSDLTWVTTEEIAEAPADRWQQPDILAEDLAFLQYTSGSTSAPKGVMLSHGNLLHNLQLIEQRFETKPDQPCVIWLPPYHDMGLIGGILQPLYTGYPVTLMAPVDFIQKPLRWLETISRTGAKVSGGPNFAYELCLQKITPEQRDGLDLSSWQVAFSGAEPVRQETIQRFAEFFAPCGFRQEAFYPCYGLAEGTLFVTGGLQQEYPVMRAFDGAQLQQNRAVPIAEARAEDRALVSSGRIALVQQRIAVVDQDKLTELADGQVGEIWVSGPSVAKGYWQKPEQTQQVFQARIAGTEEGPFLRTGDLGFVLDGELYVTGRLKDLILIRGRNYYPQDIEFTVQESHPAVKNSNGAAFAVEVAGEERLVVVQEIERAHRKSDPEAVVMAIRQAVAVEHQLQVYAVVLLKPASIPKTSSGKVQRFACRNGFVDGTLETVYQSVLDAGQEVAATVSLVAGTEGTGIENDESKQTVNREFLLTLPNEERQNVLVEYLRQAVVNVLKVAPQQVRTEQSLNVLGLDSLMAVELQNRLEEQFGVACSLARLLDGPSVADLADFVLEQLEAEPLSEPTALVTPAGEMAKEFALSYGQRALWFLQRLAPESAAYNIAHAVRIREALDAAALRQAFAVLAERHPLLRARYVLQQGQPLQVIEDEWELPFFQTEAAAWSEQDLQAQLSELARQPFDLEKGPLFRVHLFERSDTEHVLLLTMHHIVTDFWSLGVLVQELQALYAAAQKDETTALVPVRANYAEYVHRQEQILAGPRGEALWQYWQTQLRGAETVLHLPTDRPRPPVQTYRGTAYTFELSRTLTEQVQALAKQHGATLYMTLLAAFHVLLYRYTGQEDIVVGSPTTGRSSALFADTLGYFVNPIAVRAQLGGAPSFVELLQQVRQTVLQSLDHQDYPFPLLVERLQPQRDPSYPPIFQVMFALQKSHLLDDAGLTAFALKREGAQLKGALPMEAVRLEQEFVQFDLSLAVAETEGAMAATFEYNSDLFVPETIARMAGHFATLLEGMVADPSRPITELAILTEAERQLMLVDWKNTTAPYRDDAVIHQLFEEQAARTPDAPAAIHEAEVLSYAELNRLSNRLARLLRQQGVGADVPVAICLDRTLNFIVAMMAVLKAGGAYVAIDPSHPKERIAYMLEDAKTPVLLTQAHFLAQLPTDGVQVNLLDEGFADRLPPEDDNLPLTIQPEHLAYLIYTSGTTGKPKGVPIHHRGVVNLLTDFQNRQAILPGEAVSVLASLGFDVSVYEIFSTLIHGGIVRFVPDALRYGGDALFAWFESEDVRHVYLPPFMLTDLLNWLEQGERKLRMKKLVIGLEPIPESQLAELMKKVPGLQVLYGYGPTETTVAATLYNVNLNLEGDRNTPIGIPIQNTQVHLLDAHMQPVPIGVPGEIYIGGLGVSRGYLNRPELSAESFLPDPFSQKPGARLYRTGDLARFLPDGNVEFISRIDQQVKIRGFRIELGEIITLLEQHEDVQEAVVIVREDTPGQKRLVAYLVAAAGKQPALGDVRNYLKQLVPDYMVPAAFMLLDSIPVTANGKLDRKALPVPDQRMELDSQYAPPTTELERQLTVIWQEVLGIEKVGIHDNFFDLGGHSLLLVKAHEKVQELVGREFTIVEMFRHTTVATLTKFLNQAETEKVSMQEVQEQASKKRDALNRRKELRKERRK